MDKVLTTTLLEAAVLAWWLIDVTGLRWWIAMLVGPPTAVALTLALVRAWVTPTGSWVLLRRHVGVWMAALLPAAVTPLMTPSGGSPATSFALCWMLLVASCVKQAAVAEAGLVRFAHKVNKLRVQREVAAAARHAAEARLLRMQTQVQPGFVAETLASLQPWVEAGDSRSTPVLRALTASLRAAAQQVEGENVGEVCQLGNGGGHHASGR